MNLVCHTLCKTALENLLNNNISNTKETLHYLFKPKDVKVINEIMETIPYVVLHPYL